MVKNNQFWRIIRKHLRDPQDNVFQDIEGVTNFID